MNQVKWKICNMLETNSPIVINIIIIVIIIIFIIINITIIIINIIFMIWKICTLCRSNVTSSNHAELEFHILSLKT